MSSKSSRPGFFIFLSLLLGLSFILLGLYLFPLSSPDRDASTSSAATDEKTSPPQAPSLSQDPSPADKNIPSSSKGLRELSVGAKREASGQPRSSAQPQDQAPSVQAAAFVRPFTPPLTGYWVEVIITAQRMRVWQDGKVAHEWVVSTGKPDTPTPLGVFHLQNRGEWFFSPKYNQGAKWWVSFKDWGVYLFHSIPMDRQQQVIPEEARKLGTPASHGCVRLDVENAKWVYDHLPQGTPVHIHE